MKAVVFSLGCKVNSWEGSALMSGLKELGYEVSDRLSSADLYIVNTCAVTAEAEKKSRQAIARVRKFNPDAKVIVCGCASQKDPQSFAEKGVSLVYGAINKDKLLDVLNETGIKFDDSPCYYEKFNALTDVKTRAFVKIQDGCDNFCSYCIIPYLRGRSRSRPISSVLKEFDGITAKEVVLTGINVSNYNYDGVDLAGLIRLLSRFPVRLRLSSLEDNVISEELLAALKDLPDFAQHFHLSLQSGSDKVLKEMNRKYTTETFLRSVKAIRSYFPSAAITTDVIAGYSTETEEDFKQTLDFCKKVGFADIHCFEYSRREGTAGAKLPELKKDVKRRRMNELLSLKKQLKESFISQNIGKIFKVLPEDVEGDYVVGYTGNYIKVYLEGVFDDDFQYVRLTEPYGEGALGEIIKYVK
ncbi:MAG: tRNA (N(6)-L-threonylcarbamoyladenosine(37)-C(2))-methylthiotransferase MtaB [Clostridia bacterium]|nr:tRNA (N(6)-L-threonylcarbamoyladenosine(37)-C(2))-methylthiotransferase MtaB [Clostridia bacterium]